MYIFLLLFLSFFFNRGSLLTRNLGDLVKKEDFVLDSEYLTTQLVVVPRYCILLSLSIYIMHTYIPTTLHIHCRFRIYSRNWPVRAQWTPFCNFRWPFFKKGGPKKRYLKFFVQSTLFRSNSRKCRIRMQKQMSLKKTKGNTETVRGYRFQSIEQQSHQSFRK